MEEKLKFQILIPISLLNLVTTLAFDSNSNNTEVFVSYSGHSEVKDVPTGTSKPDIVIDKEEYKVIPETTVRIEEKKPEDEIVFIPNEKPFVRNEDEYLEKTPIRVADVMDEDNRDLGDILRDDVVTEPANEDILFISGKNNENIEQSSKKNKHTDTVKTKNKIIKKKRLDCSKLDCDNTPNSVCGGKMDGNKWKFRLFLNDCFFRKVNCAFRNPNNRYTLVDLEKCRTGNPSNTEVNYQPLALPLIQNLEETRRTFTARRSLNSDMNGYACSHSCPITCTEKYEPQCAVSSTGQRHMFLNHCKLDYNSCLYKVVWYTRPLSECVGGKKADVQQNRAFIAWMQKVGIVDGRGRLTITTPPRLRIPKY